MTKEVQVKRAIIVLSLLAPLMLAGCVTPMVVACRTAAQDPKGEFKYTREKADAACERAQFYAAGHVVTHNKAENRWEFNPNGVLTSDLAKVIEDQAQSLDLLLSYGSKEDARFIDWFPGFREGLEKEERIALWIKQRLGYIDTYNKFVDAVGELPAALQSADAAYFFPAGRKFYSMRVLHPLRSLEGIGFTAEYLETAKKNGLLQHVDTFTVFDSQEFAKRMPHLYDPNDFGWKKEERGWAIRSYKIMTAGEKPENNVVHYIEVFRAGVGGVEEPKPAVRGFVAAGGSNVSVFVVDYDRAGTPGFGNPDAFLTVPGGVATGKDLFGYWPQRTALLDSLYDAESRNPAGKPERKRPREREPYVSIVRPGDAPIDLWERGTWTVPFKYRQLTSSIDIRFAVPKNAEERRLEEQEKLRALTAFVRQYRNNDGNVVVIEYWTPKAEYAARNITSAYATLDVFKVRRKNGAEESGEIGYFGKGTRMVDYLFGGKWFRLMDEDGDGIFEKKRSIASPVGNHVVIPASQNGIDYP